MPQIIMSQTQKMIKADGALLALRNNTNAGNVIELASSTWKRLKCERFASGEGVLGKVIATGQDYHGSGVSEGLLSAKIPSRRG